MERTLSIETFEKNGLIFRKATIDDISKLLAFSDIFLRRDWLIRRDYLMTNLMNYEVWIVLDNEKLVAFAMAGSKKDKKTLWNLLVHPKYRDHHIGSALIEKLNPIVIRSKSDQSTGDPTAFYEKIGYQVKSIKQGRKRNITIMQKASEIRSNKVCQQ